MAKTRTNTKKDAKVAGKTKGTKACRCVDLMDAKLAETNTKLDVELFSEQCFVASMKIDPRKRVGPTRALASFCPFCGMKYPERKSIFR